MTQTNAPVIDVAVILQKQAAWEVAANALIPENKAGLFAALASAGITRVVVTFDGYGDSGQIEAVEAFSGDDAVELPDQPVEIRSLHYNSVNATVATHPVAQAIESLCYALLGQTHCGWENNDGAYGEITFDVAGNLIALDYNERFTSSESHWHEW